MRKLIKRTHHLFAATVLVSSLTACGSRIVSDNKINDVREKAQTVADASDALATEIARFDDEDWKDVVPDVRTKQADLDSAQTDLDEAVANLQK